MVSNVSDDTTPKKKLCIACKQEFSGDEATCPNDGTVLTPLTMEASIGSTIGEKYEILAVIGGGAMGLVYKARHTLMKRVVAVKMLHPNMLPDAGTLMRFKKEAEALSCLNHPNILTVFDFGISTQGQPYLVTDYLEGQTLGEVLEQNQSLPWQRTVVIFMQVCSALAHAHKNGVIHRDIKPSNIMLTEFEDQSDFVKILDFGIAKVITQETEDSSQLTRTGEVFGSPLYMSPEQCRGKPLDARSDIYSLGCVMFRALTGQPAFFGQDLVECLYKHVNEAAPSLLEVAPEMQIPQELDNIVHKCLNKDPLERYQSMVELKEALGLLVGVTSSSITEMMARPFGDNTMAQLRQDFSSASLPMAPDGGATAGGAPPPLPDNTAALERTDPEPMQHELKGNALSNRMADSPSAGIFKDKKMLIGGIAVVLFLVVLPVVYNLSKGGNTTEPGDNATTTSTSTTGEHSSGNLFDDTLDQGIDEYEEGDFDEAQEILNKAIRQGQRAKVPEDKLATALHYMVAACIAAGEYTEAEAFVSQLEHSAKVQGMTGTPKNIVAAEAYFDRASLMMARGGKNLPKARQLLNSTLKFLQTQKDSGTERMRTLAKLGQLELMDGHVDKAEALMKEAVSIAEHDPSVRQLDMALRMDQLADTYILLANSMKNGSSYYDEAETLYFRALQLRITNLKSHEHPALAQSYQRIGIMYFLREQYDKALEEFDKSLAIRSKQNKPLQLAETKRAMSYVYLKQKDFAKADATFKDAIDTAKKAGGDANLEIKKWEHGYAGLKAESKRGK